MIQHYESKYNGIFIEGQKFGGYTIINDKIILEREAKIMCQCDCGNINKVSCYTLINGKSTKCLECGNSLKKDKNPAWRGYGSVPGKWISRIKRSAKNKGLNFDLDLFFLDELYEKQNRKCALSKLDIDFDTEKASLDRVDSDLGYTKNNVQWTHKDVNLMKNNFNQNRFIEICKLISKNNE
jgi:hypothetical protein